MKQLIYIRGTEGAIGEIRKAIRTACEDLGISDDEKIGAYTQKDALRFDGVAGIEYGVERGDTYYTVILIFTELNCEVEIPVDKKFVDYITTGRSRR